MRALIHLIGVAFAIATVTGCGSRTESVEKSSSASVASSSAVGAYTGSLPAADAAGRNINVLLRQDSTATMTTEFVGKGKPIVEEGRWAQEADEVTLQLRGEGGKASGAPLIWTLKGALLVPKS